MANDITFEEFWKAYPRRLGKKRAENKWKRMTKKARLAAFDGIGRMVEYYQRYGYDFPYPETYLNGERWEDDYPSAEAEEKEKGKRGKYSAAQNTPITPSATAERERQNEARSLQREEWERHSVSHEEAMKHPDYLRALSEG